MLFSWIPTMVTIGALAACLWLDRKKAFYIRDHYPDEWERASRNPMKMRLPTARMLTLNESVAHGALAERKDPTLQRLWFKQKVLMWIGFAAIAANIAWAFMSAP